MQGAHSVILFPVSEKSLQGITENDSQQITAPNGTA